jgi:hypothetical protein
MMRMICTALTGLCLLAGAMLPEQAHAQAYWDRGNGYTSYLYFFRPNQTGVRTHYPTGSLSFGIPSAFAWFRRDNNLIIQYPSGYTDVFLVTGYDSARDILFRTGVDRTAQLGPGPWFGCRSGFMPPMIASQLC